MREKGKNETNTDMNQLELLQPETKPKIDTSNLIAAIVYTDGGCVPNPGCGGWAAVIRINGNDIEISGGEGETTNNRMEIYAAIASLEHLARVFGKCAVTIHTDSTYLLNAVENWMRKWKRNGWRLGKKGGGGSVKNRDLWERMDAALGGHVVNWKWVRGHTGNRFNERCDVLAAEEIRKFSVRSFTMADLLPR